jgi:hypothetical protein
MTTTSTIGRNNLSRQLFKGFLETTGQTRVDARNVFIHKNRKYVYVLRNNTHTIRQLYDDCAGAYVEGVGFFTRAQLQVGDVTRRSPSGIVARNARYSV